MKISMAQMQMTADLEENTKKSLAFIREAKGSDLLLFPEIQLTPFFPQYRSCDLRDKMGLDPDQLSLEEQDAHIQRIFRAFGENDLYGSPNFFVREKTGARVENPKSCPDVSRKNNIDLAAAASSRAFDRSYMIDRNGKVMGHAEMVHVLNAPGFYESDYYTQSETGFQVYDTEFGKIGIVICFDRHLPESIRTCARKGAQLILIPTVNTTVENLEMFEWELRVQAYQNNVFIAMCNRVGSEGDVTYAGESIVVDSEGSVVIKAGSDEGLVTCDIDLSMTAESRARRPYITVVREAEMYR